MTKYYPFNGGRKYILRNVSLEIPTGTNVAILGPNGAGKSTFLRLIGGAEPADKGKVVTDQDISWPLGLATGFQGSLSGRQNIQFVCDINGLSRPEALHVMKGVAEFTDLGGYFDMPVATYSSGMRARLTFGLSMSFRFDIYLIDELTSVGDAVFKRKAKAAFEEIKSRASLVYVSHNLDALKKVCDSALFLRDGAATYYPDIQDGLKSYRRFMKQGAAKAWKRKSSRQSADANQKVISLEKESL